MPNRFSRRQLARAANDRPSPAEVAAWEAFERAEQGRNGQADTTLIQRAQVAAAMLSNAEVSRALSHDDKRFKLLTTVSADFIIRLLEQGALIIAERGRDPEEPDIEPVDEA